MKDYKLNIIVPYRDRINCKKVFLREMNIFLQNSNVKKYEIFIVEQDDSKEFNKGCLLNVGFLETNKSFNYYCFNDIDTLPRCTAFNFKQPLFNTIYHPYGHRHSLGGVFLINADDYLKLNGFSTKYRNWGFEDCDFLYRANLKNVSIDRTDFAERFQTTKFYELDSQTDSSLNDKMKLSTTRKNQAQFFKSIMTPSMAYSTGLSTIEYEITGKYKEETHTHLKCKFK